MSSIKMQEPIVIATLLKSSPRSEAHQRDQILRTGKIYSLRSSELGIDSVLSAMARSMKIENVAVMMFGARENFLTHQLGFEGKSSIEIIRIVCDYLSPLSSSICITKLTADIIVNDLKVGLLVAVPSKKTPVDRMKSIITEVASTISALLNDRYLEAISPDTDLHLAQLSFLFLSMIRSPLKKVTTVRSQLAASCDFLHQLFQCFPSSSSPSSTLSHLSGPSNQEMLAYFDLFNQEIESFRQETRAFHFVVDAALRSLYHHVVSHDEEEVLGVYHHPNTNSNLEKGLSNSLEKITKSSKMIHTRPGLTHQNFGAPDIELIDEEEEVQLDPDEIVRKEEKIEIITLEDDQEDVTGKRMIFYPKTPGGTSRTFPDSSSSVDLHNHSNFKIQYKSRKYIRPVDQTNLDSFGNIVSNLVHSFPALSLQPPSCLKEVEKDIEKEEEEEEERTLSMKYIRTPVSSCSFSYSFTCKPVSRTETLPLSYTKPTDMREIITANSSKNNSYNMHCILNTHSSSDINLDSSAIFVTCEPLASCTSLLSFTLPRSTKPTLKNPDVIDFHPHHHYHYQHINDVNNTSSHNMHMYTIANKNNNSFHNIHTCTNNNNINNKEEEDEEDQSEDSVTVTVSYDWDHVTEETPQDTAGIAKAIRHTFASLSVLDTLARVVSVCYFLIVVIIPSSTAALR